MRILMILIFLTSVISLDVLAKDDEPKLLSIINSPSEQIQVMGMVLSSQALQQGSKVNVLLCGPAGDIALIDAPKSALTKLKPINASPQDLMKEIIKMGATVQVCALYLPNKGITKSDLIEGVTQGFPPVITSKMLEKETKVISF